jgi:MFS family permease
MQPAQSMDRRQLFTICICFGMMLFVATMTVGIMPVYVVRLGADAAATGLYLAFNFFGVTAGNIIGGWLTDRIGKRKRVVVVSYLIWIPATLLLTQAASVAGLILVTGLMWLPGGVVVAALNSILGLSAGQHERGRVFGWVALATGVGGLIGGLTGGPIAEQWGFPVLFIIMTAIVGLMLLISLTIRDVETTPQAALKAQAASGNTTVKQAAVGSLVYMLLAANFFARLGPTASDLGRPLVMLHLNMNAVDVSSAIAFSSAVTLPLPLILGWLSDRVGRKRLLIVFYGLAAVGILLLRSASLPWHFWLSAALVNTINSSGGVGQAYIADLSDASSIGRSLSLFTSSQFIASMIGLGGAGYVMQGIGIENTLLLGVSSLVIAILILLWMRPGAPRLAGEPVSAS